MKTNKCKILFQFFIFLLFTTFLFGTNVLYAKNLINPLIVTNNSKQMTNNILTSSITSINTTFSQSNMIEMKGYEFWTINQENSRPQLTLKRANGYIKAKNTFVSLVTTGNIISDTYYFDENGDMVTGWIKTSDGNWYFLESNFSDKYVGRMIKGLNKVIDGVNYFFSWTGALVS